MAVNVFGICGIVVFYIFILVIGLYAARKRAVARRDADNSESGEVMLAGRSIGMVVGAFTMTATWVGGGYINGTSEATSSMGLAWAQSSWGYSLSLLLGGFMFAKIMRQRGYVTLLDPFQERYGSRLGAVMYIPAFLGELLWSASTLNSLGATISVVLNLEMYSSVIVSACIALFYTFFGGLWSVAFTDVAQLICMFIGMWITIPFALTHKAVASISSTQEKWVEPWDWNDMGVWSDYALLFVFGGIPWQVYFQRVLSSKTHKRAQYLSFAAAAGCVIMAIPSILIGAIGASTTWSLTDYKVPIVDGKEVFPYAKTMPLVLQYLTPPAVSFVGLGAVSAAVMSSVDSSVLSASSMFAHNIYRTIFRPQAGEREMIWVIRFSILAVGVIATIIGLTVNTIYGLSILCSDLIYVILFPQLVCVLYFRYANAYGALASFSVGMILRFLAGEKMLKMDAVIKYPFYDEMKDVQKFPFRTLSMLITIFILWAVSIIVHVLFQKEKVPRKYDVANCFLNAEIKPFSFSDMLVIGGVEVAKKPTNSGEATELVNGTTHENSGVNGSHANGGNNGKIDQMRL